MKKLIILFAVIVMMTGFTTKVMAQATVVGTTAAAKLLVPITLNQTSPLHFGSMFKGATGGTCELSTLNARNFTGTVTASVATPTSTNAAYDVGGSLNTTYAITLPATITVTEPVSSTTMTISALLARPLSAGADQVTGTLSGTGTDNFTVGGTLTVGAAQAAGVYSGTFDVTVLYN